MKKKIIIKKITSDEILLNIIIFPEIGTERVQGDHFEILQESNFKVYSPVVELLPLFFQYFHVVKITSQLV